jgi:hypothetical protein
MMLWRCVLTYLNSLLCLRHATTAQIYSELEMVQQGKKMSEIVKKFQTVKMVFNSTTFFQRNCCFLVSACLSVVLCCCAHAAAA